MSDTINSKLDAKHVRGFLRDHPTFLDENPDILETMIVNHKPGGAISLVERQLASLRDRNADLTAQLDQLVDVARDNELMFTKTRRLVVSLLDAKSFAALIEALYESLGTDFGVESFSLTLFGDDSLKSLSMARVSSLAEATNHVPSIVGSSTPMCGTLRNNEITFLFGEKSDITEIRSVAAINLGEENQIGLLALGNQNPDFYNNKMGTLFLEYIGEILNRLLPVHIDSRS
jgi:uncharacterized protein YigA (DUF484 family)